MGRIIGLIGGLAMLPGTVEAAPIILRCDGVEVSDNAYEPQVSRIQTHRYYRIDQGHFSRLDPAMVFWPKNLCETKGAACSINENGFEVRWREDRTDHSVEINRKSGRVRENSPTGLYVGNCTPSTDPTRSGEPNRF